MSGYSYDRRPVASKRHQEVFIKVNVPVDEGIAVLVETLSEIPQLRTVSSCQGREKGFASLSFNYGTDSCQAVKFMNRLRLALPPNDENRVEATPYGIDDVSIRIKVPNHYMSDLEDAIRAFVDSELQS